MTDRMDAVMAREYEVNGEKKTAFTKIGVAFATRSGGWQIRLEAMPAPRLGRDGQPELSFLLMPPRQDNQRQQSRPQAAPGGGDGGMDDNIPFGPEWR